MSRNVNAARRVPRLAISVGALITASMLVLAPTAGAIPGNPIQPSSQLWTPFSGTVFDQATSENVSIQSNLHVVWQSADTGGGGTLHVNVADSTATGDSGNSYSFTGADEVTVQGPPIAPINVNLRLQSGPPIREQQGPPIRELNGPPIRVTVAVQLTFNEQGQLTGASAKFSHTF